MNLLWFGTWKSISPPLVTLSEHIPLNSASRKSTASGILISESVISKSGRSPEIENGNSSSCSGNWSLTLDLIMGGRFSMFALPVCGTEREIFQISSLHDQHTQYMRFDTDVFLFKMFWVLLFLFKISFFLLVNIIWILLFRCKILKFEWNVVYRLFQWWDIG